VVERAVVLGPFQGAMQEAIHALKYRQQRPLGQVLGQRMGQEKALGRVLEELDFLVPVPLHPARQRERGYNQSLEIARGLAQALERPVLDGLVARRKNTRQQARLEADERRKNLQGAFIALDTVPREGLIGLVDDVLTTGATFNACAQALLEAGAQRVWAVALACPFPQRETPVSLDAIPSGN
jgi:ComF family protein